MFDISYQLSVSPCQVVLIGIGRPIRSQCWLKMTYIGTHIDLAVINSHVIYLRFIKSAIVFVEKQKNFTYLTVFFPGIYPCL